MSTTATESAIRADNKPVSSSRKIVSPLIVGLICILVSTASVMTFFFMGEPPDGKSRWTFRMPDTHDMILHYDQAVSFYNGLKAGEVYPRWEEDTNRGFGAPTTSYYPPGVYYLTSAVYLIVHNWLGAIAGAHLFMMIASLAAIYVYARRSMSRTASVAVMIAYSAFPYHLLNQYQRGALAELMGFIWMPLMLIFGEQLFSKRIHDSESGPQPIKTSRLASTLLNMAGLAVSYGAFVWSHPPTAYQFSLMFGVFLAVLAIMRRDLKGLLTSGLASVIGLAFSAAYLYPAAAEQELIRHEYVSENWPYHQSYVFASTGYTMQYRAFFDLVDHVWLVNIGAILLAGLFAALALRFSKSKLRLLSERVIAWTIVGIVTAFMMTSLSEPLGRRIPRIDIGVFSWRMLGITTLMAALLIGASVEAGLSLWKARKRIIASLCTSAACIVLIGGILFTVFQVVAVVYSAPAFEPEEEHLNYAIIPRTAPEDPTDLPDAPQAELASGDEKVSIERWDPQNRAIKTEVTDDEGDQLIIRTFNFPGWTARVDGQLAEIKTGEDVGDIQIDLNPGPHKITLQYLDTPARRRGKWITIAAMLVIWIWFVAGTGLRRRLNRGASPPVG